MTETTYGDLLLGENDGAVLSPHAYRHYVRRSDRLERIFFIRNSYQPGSCLVSTIGCTIVCGSHIVIEVRTEDGERRAESGERKSDHH